MKNKEFVFEFINQWRMLFGKYNWYFFTPIKLYFEHEKYLKGIWLEVVVLGIGFSVRFNYDIQFLLNKRETWDAEDLYEGNLAED